LALVDALADRYRGVEPALVAYERARRAVGAAVVAHACELGAYLGGSRDDESRRHHDADAVMREIAITRAFA
jgi:hypothetical protein